MADFEVVHRRALSEARRNLESRRGDVWHIALEEPLRFDRPMAQTITVIQVCIGHDGKLHSLNAGSVDAISEWKERHKDTPNEAFEFPKIAGIK